jgi:hypothetical protein
VLRLLNAIREKLSGCFAVPQVEHCFLFDRAPALALGNFFLTLLCSIHA